LRFLAAIFLLVSLAGCAGGSDTVAQMPDPARGGGGMAGAGAVPNTKW
jgi:hypothetical protein